MQRRLNRHNQPLITDPVLRRRQRVQPHQQLGAPEMRRRRGLLRRLRLGGGGGGCVGGGVAGETAVEVLEFCGVLQLQQSGQELVGICAVHAAHKGGYERDVACDFGV